MAQAASQTYPNSNLFPGDGNNLAAPEELEHALNRKAGTVNRGAAEAANIWAGTKNLDLLGALNTKARAGGYTGPPLEIDGILRVLAGGSSTSGCNDTAGRL